MNISKNPWLAGGLSLIPGLGQMYNGQTFKGIILLTTFFASFFLFFISMITPSLLGWHSSTFFFPYGLEVFSYHPTEYRIFIIGLFTFVIWPLLIIYSIADAASTAAVNRRFAAYASGAGSLANDQHTASAQENLRRQTQAAMGETAQERQANPSGAPNMNHADATLKKPPKRGYLFWAIVFLSLGIIGFFQYLRLDIIELFLIHWPIIPLLFGLRLLFDYQFTRHDSGQLVLGTVFSLLGIIFWLQNLGMKWPFAWVEEIFETSIWFLTHFWWGFFIFVGLLFLARAYSTNGKR